MDQTPSSKPESSSSKPVLKPTSAKNLSYYHVPTNLDVYTKLKPHASGSSSRPSPGPYPNPYVPGKLLPPKLPPPRSTSQTRSSSDASLVPSKQSAPVIKTLPSSSSRPLTDIHASTSKHVASDLKTIPVPRFAPKLRPKPTKQSSSASQQQVIKPPGPDSIMIPRSIAVKMNYDDFRPGEYLVRSEWSENARYPQNLDPPNGLASLRCLFCEKQYSGPNARSMWRRHVGGKHNFTLNGGKHVPQRVNKAAIHTADVENGTKNREKSRPKKRQEPGSPNDASNGKATTDENDGVGTPPIDENYAADISGDLGHGDGEVGADENGTYWDWNDPVEGLRDVPPAIGQDQDDIDVYGRDVFHALKDVSQNVPNSVPTLGSPGIRRTMSAPSSSSHGAVESDDHPAFLLPAFSERSERAVSPPSDGDIAATQLDEPESGDSSLSTISWPLSEVLAYPSSSPPGPEVTLEALRARAEEQLLQRGLKASASMGGSSLLPSITLAPPLRSPRTGKSFSSPTPASIMGRWGASKLDDSPGGHPGVTFARPTTPDRSRRTHQYSSSDPAARPTTSATPNPTDDLSTPALGRKRKLSESDRRRWMLALESPGPLSSPAQPENDNRHGRLLSLSSPQQPQPTPSAKKPAPFFFLTPLPKSVTTPARSQPFLGSSPLTSSLDDSEAAGSSSRKGYTRSRFSRSRTASSGLDSSPAAPSSATRLSHSSLSRTPSHAHTRSSSLDNLDHHDDDPFHSSSFPFDLNLRLKLDRGHNSQEEQRARDLDMGILYSESPVLKRTREDGTGTPARELEANMSSPGLDLTDFSWDGVSDMSPVRKKARPS